MMTSIEVFGTTPTKLHHALLSFCASLNKKSKPVWVPVQAEAYYLEGYCDINVVTHVGKFGGKAVKGWNIWEVKGVQLDAEAHVVWQSPHGELVDITTKSGGEKQILFVPDESSWQGLVHRPNRVMRL